MYGIMATMIWSGNFIIAKGMTHSVPPNRLALFRFLVALASILPFSLGNIKRDWSIAVLHKGFMFSTILSGFVLQNVFIYIAGHHTSGINLGLIGTTSSPVFALLIAFFVFGQKIPLVRIIGMSLSFVGILWLLCKGYPFRIFSLRFTKGDLWALAGAFCFAVYNNIAKKRPEGISSTGFLLLAFIGAIVALLPMSILEYWVFHDAATFDVKLLGSILYLGIGCSFLAFLCWNKSISLIGVPRTVLLGNLIPLFSTIEACLFLSESFQTFHVIGGGFVVLGLVMANLFKEKPVNI